MKISKSWFFRICLIAGLFLSAQLSFAYCPVQVPIPPDNSPEPPIVLPHIMTTLLPSATATLSDTELSVSFDYSVGDATITLYDADNKVVYEETVDTDSTSEVCISVSNWTAGDIMITVNY